VLDDALVVVGSVVVEVMGAVVVTDIAEHLSYVC
jgi:hypothetical protein